MHDPIAISVTDGDRAANTLLILQFDGSCKKPASNRPAAGAGVVAWYRKDNCTIMVDQASLPLPEASSAPESEAGAAALAVNMAVPLIAKYSPETIEFQGDNKAVIAYWNGEGSFKALHINGMMDQAKEIAFFSIPSAKWTYIPRECNATADHLAGIASAAMLDAWQNLGPDDQLQYEHGIIKPLPASAFSLGDQVNTIIQTLDGDHREGLCLPECIDHAQWGKVGLLRIAQPAKMQHVITLYTVARRQHGAPIFVQYAAKTQEYEEPYGRRYPVGAGGQKLSKPARLILYGATHTEIDIEGAHLGILICLIRKYCQQHLCQEFSSVSAARTFLLEELGGTRYARAFPRYQKDSFSIMINMHISTFLAFVHTYVIGTSDRFKEVLVKFQNAKDTLSRMLPPGAPDGRVNHRNNLYFACERIEAIFIRAMIKTLYVEDAPLNPS
jgi:hypothetical protein